MDQKRKRRLAQTTLVAALLAIAPVATSRADKISLFEAGGTPVAYIDTDDELTIYLWNGQPVAYLEPQDRDVFHVYGFNGRHLGWFERGAIWDKSGYATCAVKEAMPGRTSYEPYKSYKKYKPHKVYKQYWPSKPRLTGNFSNYPCAVHLATGGK